MSNQLSWSIIKTFSEKNTLGFRFQDVVKEFPGKHRVYLARVLSDMVEKGMLCKMARNLYHIIPLDANPENYEPDRFQMAKYLMLNKEYYIAFASALRIHGQHSLSASTASESGVPEPEVSKSSTSKPTLSKSSVSKSSVSKPAISKSEISEPGVPESSISKSAVFENTVYVATAKPNNPGSINIGDTNYHFIPQSADRFFGFDSIWINQSEEVMVSSFEKTIADIAAKPRYGGGIVELGKVLFRGNKYINHNNLFYCLSRNENKSAKKRILFLTDLLGLEWSEKHDSMLNEIGSGISLLDPSEPDQGKKRSDFGLKINMDPSHIRRQVYG